MKFSVMHADFAASLDKLTAVVPAKPNLQVLSCVHLRLTEKTLVILANNLSLAVKVEIPARNDEPGEIAVNFKTLIEWVKSFKPTYRIDAEVIPGLPAEVEQQSCQSCSGKSTLPCIYCNGTRKCKPAFSKTETDCTHCEDGTRKCSCAISGHPGVVEVTKKIAIAPKLALSCVNRRLSIPLNDNAAEFPQPPDAAEHPYKLLFVTEADGLHTVIAQTLPAIATEDNRPILTGGLWAVRPVKERKDSDLLTERGTDKLTLDIAGTDGYRLHVGRLPLLKSEQFSAIVPGDTMKYLLKNTVNKAKNEEGKLVVEIYQSNQGHMMFSLGNMGVYSITLDGRFPDYEVVIPSITPVTVHVNPDELATNIKSVSSYAKEAQGTLNMQVKPAENDHKLTVRAVSPRGDSEVDQPVIFHAENDSPVHFCLNYEYVLDALTAVQDKHGCVISADAYAGSYAGEPGLMGPTVFKGVRNPNFIAVIMPKTLER